MKLSINLVTWNGAKYLPLLFESLKKQTFKDWEMVIIDNGSSDGTVEAIKNEAPNLGVAYKFIINPQNVGFAAAHNQSFRESAGEYFLVLNQDIYLAPDCLEKLINFLDIHPGSAAASPALYKWNFAEGIFTNEPDSFGFKVLRNRRVVEIKKAPHGEAQEVFGVSAACAMFRRSAMETVLLGGQMFDELYGSYKEDVDLAWRLRQRELKSFVVLDALAYHDRRGSGSSSGGDWSAVKNKKAQADWVVFQSYKNHLMTLYKNEYAENLLIDGPWILWYEFKKFVYFLLFNRPVFKGLKEIWQNRAELKRKREEIKKFRTAGWETVRLWWK